MPYPPYRPEHNINDRTTFSPTTMYYVEEIRALRRRLKLWESAALDALANLRDEEPAAKRLRLELTEQEKAA